MCSDKTDKNGSGSKDYSYYQSASFHFILKTNNPLPIASTELKSFFTLLKLFQSALRVMKYQRSAAL